jgi:hypothetical protein
MKLTNETRRQRIATSGGRPVDGLVRVRALDVRVLGRGFVVENREPVAVLVSEDGSEARFGFPRSTPGQLIMMAAAPIAAFAVARLLRPKRSR